MKHVLKTVALAALVASSHAVLAETSPFPLAAETNVGQPALDTYADQQARLGRLDMSGPSSFPMAAEANVGQPPLDTYADQMARNGTLIIGSGSPYPVAAESNVGQPPLDTFADRYARATRFADEPGRRRRPGRMWRNGQSILAPSAKRVRHDSSRRRRRDKRGTAGAGHVCRSAGTPRQARHERAVFIPAVRRSQRRAASARHVCRPDGAQRQAHHRQRIAVSHRGGSECRSTATGHVCGSLRARHAFR